MFVEINHNTTDGIITRDELLAMGCTEVKSGSGRKAYLNGDEVVAVECTRCFEVKREELFTKRRGRFCEVSPSCRDCKNKERRNHYKTNPDSFRKSNRKYYDNNTEKLLCLSRKYREENFKKTQEYDRKRYEMNPEKYVVKRLIRRSRINALPDNLTPEHLTEINAFFYNTCALSGDPTNIHADHVIPISSGHGGTTYGNMIPLTAELNLSKHASHLFEWFDANHERFNLSRDKFNALIDYLADANEMTPTEYRKYTDWCFDNPMSIDATTGELVFINERKAVS